MRFNFIIERPTLRHLKDYRCLHNKFLVPRVEPIISLDLLKALSGNMTVFIGQHNDQNLVVNLVLNDGNIARGLFLARNEAIRETYYIGSTLQWEVLSHYKRLGYMAYDMGGLLGGHLSTFGVDQYKISYGGEISPQYFIEAALTPSARLFMGIKKVIRKKLRRFRKVNFH